MDEIKSAPIRVEEFAKMLGVTSNNIRKHIKKHYDELQEHIEVIPNKGGTKLDDYAQNFIRGLLRDSPVVIEDSKTLELLEENNKLLHQLNELLIESTELKLAATRHLELQEAHEDLKQKLQEAEDRAINAEADADVQRETADNLHRDLIATVREKEELQETNRKQGNLINRIDDELQKAATLNAQLTERAEQAEAELEALKNRSFWARLFNKE